MKLSPCLSIAYTKDVPIELCVKLLHVNVPKHLSSNRTINYFRNTSGVRVPVSGVANEKDYNVHIYTVAPLEQLGGKSQMLLASVLGATSSGHTKIQSNSLVGYKRSGRVGLKFLEKSKKNLKRLRLKIIWRLIRLLKSYLPHNN